MYPEQLSLLSLFSHEHNPPNMPGPQQSSEHTEFELWPALNTYAQVQRGTITQKLVTYIAPKSLRNS